MRVIKTIEKQIQYAKNGKLFIIENCGYKQVTAEFVSANQQFKFFGKK